jgi:hypothetical protein
MRVRALRDRLNLHCRHELSVDEKCRCILELLTFAFDGHALRNARRHIAKLKTSAPNPTPEQVSLIEQVESRYSKRESMIRERAAKKELGEPIFKKKKPTVPKISPVDIWSQPF